MQPLAAIPCCQCPHNIFLLELYLEARLLHKTLIACAAVVALGCVPAATNVLAAGHPGDGQRGDGHAAAGYAVAGHAMAGPARGGHVMGGYPRGGRIARYGSGGYNRAGPVFNGPIYDSCPGYSYGPGYGRAYAECPGYSGVPVVGGLINGILGGYDY